MVAGELRDGTRSEAVGEVTDLRGHVDEARREVGQVGRLHEAVGLPAEHGWIDLGAQADGVGGEGWFPAESTPAPRIDSACSAVTSPVFVLSVKVTCSEELEAAGLGLLGRVVEVLGADEGAVQFVEVEVMTTSSLSMAACRAAARVAEGTPSRGRIRDQAGLQRTTTASRTRARQRRVHEAWARLGSRPRWCRDAAERSRADARGKRHAGPGEQPLVASVC